MSGSTSWGWASCSNFVKAGVDLEAMQYLQEEDLIKMGITGSGRDAS